MPDEDEQAHDCRMDDYFPDQSIPEEDSGASTQARFRYQHLIASLLCIKMYLHEIRCEEIYCELHDDILIKVDKSTFESVQVKTRESKLGPFKLTDEPIVSCFQHFVGLDKSFPKKFSLFRIVSNCEFRSIGSDLDIDNFLANVEEIRKDNSRKLPKKLDQILIHLADNCKVNKQHVIDVLCRVKLSKEADMDALESIILSRHLKKIPQCSGFSVPKLERVLKSLEQTVNDASSNVLKDPSIKDYFTFLEDGKTKLQNEVIASRRITPETVENVIRESSDTTFYLKSGAPLKLLEKSDIALMHKKMLWGGIDRRSIANMKACVTNAEEFLYSKYYKGEWKDGAEINEKAGHIQQLILTRADESQTEAEQTVTPYGSRMLSLLGKRLENLTDRNYADFLPIPYDVLKGFVGMLSGHCLIWFSQKPEENMA